jgi:hypothetical protein
MKMFLLVQRFAELEADLFVTSSLVTVDKERPLNKSAQTQKYTSRIAR